MAGACICGKAHVRSMFVFDGICMWCGHGTPSTPVAKDRRGPRLPRDLGALQREGRRVPLRFPNVVHMDRLRGRMPRWVPRRDPLDRTFAGEDWPMGDAA